MILDDSARRQLRFSLALQSAAGLMLLVAFVTRVVIVGWDVFSLLLFGGAVVVGGAWAWTFRTLRDNRPRADS